MKKLISILIAAMVLAFATSAMAEISTDTVTNRTLNTLFAASPDDVSAMPAFFVDDEVKFTIYGVQENDWITLLTYKYGEEPSDTTVQYIDQYTASSTAQDITYFIRDIGTGIYVLKIRAGENDLYTVYYRVIEEEEPVLVGDVNGNGKVNAQDVAFLARHLAYWAGYETVNGTASDVNGNGKVNAQDVAILARHLAGWTGYETLPYTK